MQRLNTFTRMIFVVGGAALGKEKDCLKSVEFCDNSNGKFQLMSQQMSEARRSPALVHVSSDLLIIGGFNGSAHLNNIERLCPQTKSINSCDLEIPDGFSCAAYCQTENSCAYIFGGYNGEDCMRTVIRVDSKSATNQALLMTRLKNSTAISVSKNEILLFGGWDEKETMDTIFLYNTTDGSQAFHSRLPYPLEGHSIVKHKDSIFVVGGFNGLSVINNIVRYELSTKKAEILPVQLEITRENHACVIVEEMGHHYLLVIGGWNGREALRNCEKFQIVNEYPWLKRVGCTLELGVARNRPAAIVV